jgi:hypothetical protein
LSLFTDRDDIDNVPLPNQRLNLSPSARGCRLIASWFILCAAGEAAALARTVWRPLSAQDLPFPIRAFVERDSIALTLLRYDACAWRSSDALLQHDSASFVHLGPDWLCYVRGERWNAVFGRFDSTMDSYGIVVHYVLSDTIPLHSSESLDTAAVTAGVRAIHRAHALLPSSFFYSGFRFNTYVLSDSSHQTVWILPAWQPTGETVFGGEAEYAFDPTGHQLETQRVVEGPFRWYRPDSTVAFRLDSNSPDIPTVGDLFLFHLVRHYFKSIRIKTGKYSSSLVATDSGEVWVHAILHN